VDARQHVFVALDLSIDDGHVVSVVPIVGVGHDPKLPETRRELGVGVFFDDQLVRLRQLRPVSGFAIGELGQSTRHNLSPDKDEG